MFKDKKQNFFILIIILIILLILILILEGDGIFTLVGQLQQREKPSSPAPPNLYTSGQLLKGAEPAYYLILAYNGKSPQKVSIQDIYINRAFVSGYPYESGGYEIYLASADNQTLYSFTASLPQPIFEARREGDSSAKGTIFPEKSSYFYNLPVLSGAKYLKIKNPEGEVIDSRNLTGIQKRNPFDIDENTEKTLLKNLDKYLKSLH